MQTIISFTFAIFDTKSDVSQMTLCLKENFHYALLPLNLSYSLHQIGGEILIVTNS